MNSFRSLVCVLLLMAAPFLAAQQSATTVSRPQSEAAPAAHGRLLLVLPFENHSGHADLNWIGEAFPEIFNRRLSAAGFLPISRNDRMYALDRLGLPPNFQPSRASTIRIAQTLDADYVVFGSFTTSGNSLNATAQVLDVTGLRLGNPINMQADMTRLLDIVNTLAWYTARQLDPKYAVAQQTFLNADSDLRVEAFENYIRGLTEDSIGERLRHLREAVRLAPHFSPAMLALGKAYFYNQNFDLAAATLGNLPKDDPNALEADFYRGLAFFYTGKYLEAEDAFAFDTTRLPLPEVVNNQGVAAARRGRDGTSLFQQASAADPKDPDYHFNLAVSLRRRGDIPGAVREIDQAVKLRPQDTDAVYFANSLHSEQQNPAPAAQKADLPLERIKRSYNEASFRQAAFEMEQMQNMRLAMLPPAEHAEALVKDGTQFLNRGLLLEAEREFQAAIQADPNSASAHARLAEVRERTNDLDAARQEAQKSLQIKPNVAAHLVLARMDEQAHQLAPAANEISEALKIEPNNPNARVMKMALEQKGQQVP
ncbi:MAG TPA: tetratricopeptide repeat protein [Pseudacidobacterium sp.]|nr:tetratricopeptide repeat protein [Pseudacidobacterium sp.]